MTKTLEQRFWEKVTKTESCWLWNAATFKTGYGAIGVGSKVEYAHRLSWNIHFGEIPNGHEVCHKCDVRNCVNPSHLFTGTRLDNVRDAVSKGRNAKGSTSGMRLHPERHHRGEWHPQHKLRECDVVSIRNMYKTTAMSQKQIGQLFAITQTAVGLIVRKKRWAHIQ